MVIELRSPKRRIFDVAVVIVCVCMCGVAKGVDRGCTPLPTRPQRFCDPASLVRFMIDAQIFRFIYIIEGKTFF